ncbi:C4-dicarboxylate TRAP transporter substrate-binding protein (plasmid) [Tistrella bauzanensis]|uniref:C4-dicarboxylate TRAP transporter substrate-binding protein n=1 Tax=Tistrella TaxID=171436 RepID=UPI0031F6E056
MKTSVTMAAMACVLALGLPAREAAARTSLSLTQYGPDRGWQADLLKAYAERVREASGGELDIRITFGGALIAAKDVLRGVGDGVADLGSFIAVYTPAELFNYRVGDLPVGSTDPWVGNASMMELARTNPVVKGEFDAQNTVLLANSTATEVVLICKEPLTALDQLDGMKLRANPPHSLAFETFGAVMVSVTTPDVYQALDRGLIACAQTYVPTILPYRQYEVAPHVTMLDFGQNLAFGLVMNKRKFERLTPALQQVLVQAGEAYSVDYARHSLESFNQIKTELASDHGVTFHTLSDADHDRLTAAGQDTVEAFLDRGDPGVLQQFQALQKTYTAELQADGYPWARH